MRQAFKYRLNIFLFLLPALILFVGILIAPIFMSAYYSLFDWKGIGVVVVDALDKYDFPVIMGAVLLIAVMLIIVNIVVDIIYGFIDPRVRIN